MDNRDGIKSNAAATYAWVAAVFSSLYMFLVKTEVSKVCRE